MTFVLVRELLNRQLEAKVCLNLNFLSLRFFLFALDLQMVTIGSLRID